MNRIKKWLTDTDISPRALNLMLFCRMMLALWPLFLVGGNWFIAFGWIIVILMMVELDNRLSAQYVGSLVETSTLRAKLRDEVCALEHELELFKEEFHDR